LKIRDYKRLFYNFVINGIHHALGISWLGMCAESHAERVIPHISTQPISDAIY